MGTRGCLGDGIELANNHPLRNCCNLLPTGSIGWASPGVGERTRVKPLNPILISGREVLPLVEGGKGISVSNGQSTGAWAGAGGVGTFSGVNADSFDENGQ